MGAYLPLLQPLIDLGIDPRTGLPLKAEAGSECCLELGMNMILNQLDCTQTINRYKYRFLPRGLDAEVIERIIYYRGACCIFYNKEQNKFYSLPFNIGKQGLDIYGRYKSVVPMIFSGGTDDTKDEVFIQGLDLTVIYDIPLDEEITLDMFENGCVLLFDRTRQVNPNNLLSRWNMVQPLIAAEAEAYPFARTNIISNSGVKAYRVTDATEAPRVDELGRKATNCAKSGKPFMGVQGTLEFQDLTSGGSATKSEEYLLYLQSIDNFRQGTIGVGDGAIFEKKAHMLNREAGMNGMCPGQILRDGLDQRLKAFKIFNIVWDQLVEVDISDDLDMGVDQAQNNQDAAGFIDDQAADGTSEGGEDYGSDND